ncbi:MAG: single-stranded DNA-binding protein [Chlamydiia bacterium]|nr:single-stranded DNA-binding protein [Chlamydiia bacterium]MCB1115536.1 single-stranded DNA-binding protein [Chlamydiia bacterium]
MNQMTIMGHLGSDPEVRFTSSGQKVTTLRVACNQRRGGKDETFWWRVTLWGESFDKVLSFFKKGSAIIVAGEMLKPEIYNNKEGQPQVALNLVGYHIAFPPFGKSDRQDEPQQRSSYGQNQQQSFGGGDQSMGQQQQQGQQQQGQSYYQPQESNAFSEDEIPF